MEIGKRLVVDAGIDEAGRGPLAGPVTAACVVMPAGYDSPLIRDSKALTALKRENAYSKIIEDCLYYAVVSVGARRIDSLNIRRSTQLAMKFCAERVYKQIEKDGFIPEITYLIDGDMKFSGANNEIPIVKGDKTVPCISAASILAKVTRDRLMDKLDCKYPVYCLREHKGYPTAKHKQLIAENGASPIHRQTFRGVSEQNLKQSTLLFFN